LAALAIARQRASAWILDRLELVERIEQRSVRGER
jgi:hypothetical protein